MRKIINYYSYKFMITTVSNILLILYALFHGAFSSLKKKRFKKVF